MPIKPENKHLYPDNWKEIREHILERANNCCEGSPDFPDCRHEFDVNVISAHGRELLKQNYQDLKEWIVIGGQDE